MTWADVDRAENGGEDTEDVTVILEITVTEEHDMVRMAGESDEDLYFRARRHHEADRDSEDHWEGVEIRVR